MLKYSFLSSVNTVTETVLLVDMLSGDVRYIPWLTITKGYPTSHDQGVTGIALVTQKADRKKTENRP